MYHCPLCDAELDEPFVPGKDSCRNPDREAIDRLLLELDKDFSEGVRRDLEEINSRV